METVEFDNCKALFDTGSALRIEIEGNSYWIPHSQIHVDSEIFDAEDNSEGKLVISEWIAQKKGLI